LEDTVKINNRWFQLCASLIAMIMIANLQYAWTLFVKPMQQATGWKLSEIQWAFTLFILFQTVVQPAQGVLIDRLGPGVFTTVAGVLCGIGWAGLGLVTTLPMLYTLYVIAGIGAALVYGGCMGSALKWCTKERGLAAGIIAVSSRGARSSRCSHRSSPTTTAPGVRRQTTACCTWRRASRRSSPAASRRCCSSASAHGRPASTEAPCWRSASRRRRNKRLLGDLRALRG
jgi:hypothetical protein